MKILFDFDDVLFNTRKFKKDYFEIFKRHGVSKNVFDECYYDSLDEKDIKHYDPTEHIRKICEKIEIDLKVFNEEIEDFLRDTSGYVFKDVLPVLEKFQKTELQILSFSKTNFQKTKIYNSGIVNFFDQIRITNQMKGKVISEMIHAEEAVKKQRIFFIDDRVEQLESVKWKCPQVATILCDRKEGRYHDKMNNFCDYGINNLEELEKIVRR